MDLHPCGCGADTFERRHHLEQVADAMMAVYEGVCPDCGSPRSYAFRTADEPPPAPPAFGGADPSQIIDPGEFMWISDQISTDVGLQMLNTPQPTHQKFHSELAYAVAALEEVVKFLPEGADRISDRLFTSQRGRRVWEKDPNAFERQWLMDKLDRKRRILANVDNSC
jgi:hypothetical protein